MQGASPAGVLRIYTRLHQLCGVQARTLREAGADQLDAAQRDGRRRVFVKHTLRNSLIPVVTYLGADLGLMLGGTVVVESIFNLRGIGELLTTSIQNQEGAVVVGVATLLVLAFLAINLVVDLRPRRPAAPATCGSSSHGPRAGHPFGFDQPGLRPLRQRRLRHAAVAS